MGFILKDAWLVFRKEVTHLARDKRSQLLTFVLPILAIGAFALSFSGQNLQPGVQAAAYPLGVQDLDGTAGSREFTDLLRRSDLFILHTLSAEVNPSSYLFDNDLFAVLILPEGFGESFEAGNPNLAFLTDDSKAIVSYAALVRVQLVLDAIELNQGRGAEFDIQNAVSNAGDLDVFIPGIIVLLLAFTSLNDISSSLVRERNEGTLGRVFLSPAPKAAFLAGKVAAGMLLALARALLLLGLAIATLEFNMRGSFWLFLLITGLVGLVTLGIGILLAARARTEREVMIATLLVTIILMFLMGAITPIDLMSETARFFANGLPHTHGTEALRLVMLLDAGFERVLWPILILAGSGILATAAGSWAFRRAVD